MAPLLDRVGAFNVFSSAWFSAIYLLLFISLVGCLVPRAKGHVQALLRKPPEAPARLDRMPASAVDWSDPASPARRRSPAARGAAQGPVPGAGTRARPTAR